MEDEWGSAFLSGFYIYIQHLCPQNDSEPGHENEVNVWLFSVAETNQASILRKTSPRPGAGPYGVPGLSRVFRVSECAPRRP
jgi:hypothetical protein